MVSPQYSELIFKQHLLTNVKSRDKLQETEWNENKTTLLVMELKLSAKDIIESVKDAFKHIPPRN